MHILIGGSWHILLFSFDWKKKSQQKNNKQGLDEEIQEIPQKLEDTSRTTSQQNKNNL